MGEPGDRENGRGKSHITPYPPVSQAAMAALGSGYSPIRRFVLRDFPCFTVAKRPDKRPSDTLLAEEDSRELWSHVSVS